MTLPVDPQLLFAFLAITLLLVLTPGPAVLFVLATGVSRGRRAVLLATLGLNLANVVWFAAAALGLAALAKAHAALFGALRYAGVAYLLWLALGHLRTAFGSAGADPLRRRRSERPFRDGFLVQIANPKALIYITAILPPFIDPARPLAPQLVLLAGASIAVDAASMLAYGLGGAALTARMTRPGFRRGFSAATAALLGAAAALILIRH